MGPDAMLLVGDQSVRKWENSALRSPSSGWPCGWSSRVSIQQTRPDWGPVPLPWFVSGSLPEIQHIPWIRGALLWQPAAWLGSRGICPFCVLNQLGTDTRNQIGFRSQNKSGKGPRLVQPDPACGCTLSGPPEVSQFLNSALSTHVSPAGFYTLGITSLPRSWAKHHFHRTDHQVHLLIMLYWGVFLSLKIVHSS